MGIKCAIITTGEAKSITLAIVEEKPSKFKAFKGDEESNYEG